MHLTLRPLATGAADIERRCAAPDAVLRTARDAGIEALAVATPGGELCLWHRGPAAARARRLPVLLLHGVTYSSMSVFDLVVPGRPRHDYSLMLRLAAEGFDVFALDLEGYGLSQTSADGGSLGSYVAGVRRAMRTIAGIAAAKPMVVGWSWGAQIGARAVTADPGAAAALVYWGASWGGGQAGAPAAIRALAVPAAHRRINGTQHAGADFRTPANYDQAVRASFVAWSLLLDPTSPTVGLGEVATSLPLHDPAGLSCPVLVVHGDGDTMVSPVDLREFVDRVPHERKRYDVIPGADHNVQLGRGRAALVASIAAFASALPSDPAAR